MKPQLLGRSVRLHASRAVLFWLAVTVPLLGFQYHLTRGLEARVRFSVTLNINELSSYEASLNDHLFVNGSPSGLGRKTLTIIAPNAEPFQTNFFVWYGGASLGAINLEPSRGKA